MRYPKAKTDPIPRHLEPFVARQDPEAYTWVDHAGWRYILRASQAFFRKHAHRKYLDGLKETGISAERIPLVSEMDRCLRKFGWRAVPVNGFIPPAVFMEFQSLGILPISCDMRKLDHLAYTPAPDIVHEAAGHAPIIADPEYASYLRAYGEVSRKAIFSSKDMAQYEAIRNLSIVKEDPASTPARVAEAQDRLNRAVSENDYVSEASYLARMNWWTVEYGLIGDLKDPKIYGAGLLSSVGESRSCLNADVKKIPFTLDCVNMSYDITRPQPQLFVTPDFHAMRDALDAVAETMAFRRGGMEGLAKAKIAGTVTTSVLESGIQMSGILSDFLADPRGRAVYLKFSGPCQLGFDDAEIAGQGPKRHPEGYGTPVGALKGGRRAISALKKGKKAALRYVSGVVVEGRVKGVLKKKGRAVLVTFDECTVRRGAEVLFQPAWGEFDLAVGEKVASVFGGAADRGAFLAATGGYGQKPGAQKSNLTEETRELNELYRKVRDLRESGRIGTREAGTLDAVAQRLDAGYPEDWLLRLELIELARTHGLQAPWEKAARSSLARLSGRSKTDADLIGQGLRLIDQGEL